MGKLVAVKGECPESLELRPNETYVGSYWQAYGCSWAGNRTRRNGKSVVCGHKHATKHKAENCMIRMVREKPGNCQRYCVAEIHVTSRAKKKAE